MDQSPKSEMRTAIKAALAEMDADDRCERSARIGAHIMKMEAYRSAGTVLLYASLPSEVDLDGLIESALSAGKRVCVPRVDWVTNTMVPARITNLDTDLVVGRHGLRSADENCDAIPVSGLEMVLVPGLAFDRLGGRLGRGKGFYDRLLDGGIGCLTVGVCFARQLVGRVVSEAHDQPMDRVVCEDGELKREHG